jgi:hypothetical protein
MSFESELVAYLSSSSAITALVQDRIFPIVRDQESDVPAIVYSLISRDEMMNINGPDASLKNIRVQFDCWTREFDAVVDLALALRNAVASKATNISFEIPVGGFDDYEHDTKLYRRSFDVSCWFRESP